MWSARRVPSWGLSSATERYTHQGGVSFRCSRRRLGRRPSGLSPRVLKVVAYSTVAEGQPALSMDMALSVANATHSQIDRGLQGQALEQLQTQAGAPLADRWNGMLQLFMTTTVNNIVPLGFSADQQGIMAYNQQFSTLIASGGEQTNELRGLNKKIWELMLLKAFNAKLGDPITLHQAREIQAKISARLLSPDFHDRVDKVVGEFGASATEAEKHSKLLTLIMDGQMEIISEHSYDGEEGFVRFQAQLMEHSQDSIIQSSAAAVVSVYERAGLTT